MADGRAPGARVVVGLLAGLLVAFAAFYQSRPDGSASALARRGVPAVEIAVGEPSDVVAKGSGAAVPDTWLRQTLLDLRTMNDTDLCPEHSDPLEKRTRAGKAMCTMAVLGMPEVCGQGRPGAGDVLGACTRRWGTEELTKALPSKCRDSAFWATYKQGMPAKPAAATGDEADVTAVLPPARRPAGVKNSVGPHNRENVIRAQVVDAPSQFAPRRYVPPSERTFRTDLPKRECRVGDMDFEARPLSFGYPEDAMAERPLNVSERAWGFFPFVRRYTLKEHVPYRLGEQDEFVTQQFYRRSHFVFTHRRGGWDCWRHLEALAAGTVPYMPDLAQCDRLCLAHYPKHVMERALALPGVSHIGRVAGPHTHGPAPAEGQPTAGPANESYYLVVRPELEPPSHANPRRVPEVDFARLDEAAYMELAREGLAWVRKYQSTKAIVSYMLHEAGHEEPRSVLLVTRDGMDYLEFTVEHGLAALGINYTVVHERPFLRHVTYDPAKGMPSSADMDWQRRRLRDYHGQGVGFGFRLPHTRQVAAFNMSTKPALVARIEASEFDLVISYIAPWDVHPLLRAAAAVLPKNRVLIFDGSDNINGEDSRALLHEASQLGMVFQRELEDRGC